MKKLAACFFVTLTLVLAGCATTLDTSPTAAPAPTVQAPAPNQIAPAAQVSPVAPTAAPSKCQSKVTGKVLDAKGAASQGATVDIKGSNFTSKTISDNNGLYGFAGLCAGSYSFAVQLPGQATAKALAITAKLDGSNSVKLDLTVK